MAKSGSRVGIDLEQSSIAGVQVKARSGRFADQRRRASAARRPAVRGRGRRRRRLAAELKAFWKESGFTGKRFSLGVANQKIVVRTMEFPIIDAKELRAAIEFQAQEAIPIPLDDAILDFQVLATVAVEDGGGRQKVLIVAAQRDMIEQFTEVAQEGRSDLSTASTCRPSRSCARWRRRWHSSTRAPRARSGALWSTSVQASPTSSSPSTTRRSSRASSTSAARPSSRRWRATVACLATKPMRLRLNVGLTGADPAFGDLRGEHGGRGPRGPRRRLRGVRRRDPPVDRLLSLSGARGPDRDAAAEPARVRSRATSVATCRRRFT